VKSHSSFKIGRILGKCQLLQQIGQGGMGSVYVAKHLFLKRMVTVKLLKWSLSDLQERTLEAFEQGAIALARLNHPNIATIYDIDEDNGRPYVVMEFVDGEDVGSILKRKGAMPPARAAAVARDVARALVHAHAEGVIHRDIKPSNILISSKGQVKVIDFGLAVQIAPSTAGRDSPYVEGTPHYLSPEQVHGQPLDGRSDIYSLGVSLYEMLVGERPFQGNTETSVMLKHVDAKRPTVPIRRSGSAGPLAAIIETMMALNPKDRYPTAQAAADALKLYLAKRASLLPRRPLPGDSTRP
jgi:eukaryotic-like serine/threonine-protein kinase